jgi:hypothetical protein
MKIDPVALTQKLAEANVHPGFYKMLGLKGPSYKWVKCPINEVNVGDTIKIVEYYEIPKDEVGDPDIPEGWGGDEMQEQCGKEFKVVTREEAGEASVDIAYVQFGALHVKSCQVDYYFCWHDSSSRPSNYNYETNLFYVRRACGS